MVLDVLFHVITLRMFKARHVDPPHPSWVPLRPRYERPCCRRASRESK
jgi:hypothetical protein